MTHDCKQNCLATIAKAAEFEMLKIYEEATFIEIFDSLHSLISQHPDNLELRRVVIMFESLSRFDR